MKGQKLLMIRPMLIDEKDPSKFRPGVNTLVAVDNLGAGLDELVLFASGSSARQTAGMKSLPIDAAVVGIVDAVDILGEKVYKAEG